MRYYISVGVEHLHFNDALVGVQERGVQIRGRIKTQSGDNVADATRSSIIHAREERLIQRNGQRGAGQCQRDEHHRTRDERRPGCNTPSQRTQP